MYLYNMYIGKDRNNNPLKCGDICQFEHHGAIKKGLIIYNEHTFSFELAFLDKSFIPLRYISDFLEYLCSINIVEPERLENYGEWRKLYSGHLRLREVNVKIAKVEQQLKQKAGN